MDALDQLADGLEMHRKHRDGDSHSLGAGSRIEMLRGRDRRLMSGTESRSILEEGLAGKIANLSNRIA